ncbi:hypothetical protein JCM15519_04720 [Fundidesulfovibrio butyratiphilus]
MTSNPPEGERSEGQDPVLEVMHAASALRRLAELLQLEEKDVGTAFTLNAISERLQRAGEAIDNTGRV